MVYTSLMIAVHVVETIRKKYELLHAELDERRRRLWAASEAQALGHGGVGAGGQATGLAESTIRLGQRELGSQLAGAPGGQAQRHIRALGGGRKPRAAQHPLLLRAVAAFQQRDQPVVSVDTKKKELVGDFANSGREYHPIGQPELVRVYDFIDKELGKAIPYGVYDVTANQGWVSVGTDHDTAQFAVET